MLFTLILVCTGLVETSVYQAGSLSLTSVPLHIPESSHTVNLSYTQISTLEAGAFSHLTLLQTLLVSHAAVSQVSDQAFVGTVMEVLDLSHNQLTQAPSLQTLHLSLRDVTLSANSIFSLTHQLTNLSLLSKADFSSNLITNISNTALCGTQLTELKLTRNLLDKVPQLGQCVGETLIKLQLSYNHITEIDSEDFFGLSVLKQLELSFNRISVLPEYGLRWLSSLHKLEAFSAEVETVHDLAFFNTSLTTLHLEYNRFSVWPNLSHVADTLTAVLLPPISDFSKLSTLPRLYQLSVEGDSESSIPALGTHFPALGVLQIWGQDYTPVTSDVVEGMSFLTQVVIVRTSLTQIPDLQASAAGLRHLDLRSNRIQTIRASDLRTCHRLSHLTLYSNQLTSIESGAFEDCGPSLELLHLQDNPSLGDVTPSVYKSLVALRSLSLRETGATVLPDLRAATSLESLDLSENPLVVADSEHVISLPSLTSLTLQSALNNLSTTPNLSPLIPNLTSLDLSGNRFPCDCSTVWIQDLLASSQAAILLVDEKPCVSPEPLTEQALADIPRHLICEYNTVVVRTHWRSECVTLCSLQRPDLCVGLSYDVTTSLCSLNVTHQLAPLMLGRQHALTCLSDDQEYMTCT